VTPGIHALQGSIGDGALVEELQKVVEHTHGVPARFATANRDPRVKSGRARGVPEAARTV
jgi:hypothetical protein